MPPDERVPRLELEGVPDRRLHRLPARPALAEQFPQVEEPFLASPHEHGGRLVDLRVAREDLEVGADALVPLVDAVESGSEPAVRILDGRPGCGIREGMEGRPVCLAGVEELLLAPEVRVDRVALDTCALGDRRDRRPRRPDARVQVHGRLDDSLPGLRLTIGPPFELVLSFHHT